MCELQFDSKSSASYFLVHSLFSYADYKALVKNFDNVSYLYSYYPEDKTGLIEHRLSLLLVFFCLSCYWHRG